MEVNITKKYAKDLSNGKLMKHLKVNESGTFFVGSIKFKLLNTKSHMKKIEVSLWPENASEPMFIAKVNFLFGEGMVFTFEPISLQLDMHP